MTKSFTKSNSYGFFNNICGGGISFLISGFLKRTQKVLAFTTDFFQVLSGKGQAWVEIGFLLLG